jgi:hypothetical protein
MMPFCDFGTALWVKNAAESFQLGPQLLMSVNIAFKGDPTTG